MLVTARSDNLFAQAHHLGVDIDGALEDERLILLTYRQSFALSVGHALSSEQVAGDLERILKPFPPARVVIDGLAPFVMGALPVAPTISALMSVLERLGATSLLTFPERVSVGYDRTLEPLIQSAAAIVHLAAEPGGVRRAEASNVRYTSPTSTIARFMIHERPAVVVDKVVRTDRHTVPARAT